MLNTLVNYKSMRAYRRAQDDLRSVANDVPASDTRQLEIAPDDNIGGFRIRAINAHAIPIQHTTVGPPIRHPGMFMRGKTLAAAHQMLHKGLEGVDRQEIHLVDYWYTQRQAQYIHHRDSMVVWLAIGGHEEKKEGRNFPDLPNGVIVIKGLGGSLPPRVWWYRHGYRERRDAYIARQAKHCMQSHRRKRSSTRYRR